MMMTPTVNRLTHLISRSRIRLSWPQTNRYSQIVQQRGNYEAAQGSYLRQDAPGRPLQLEFAALSYQQKRMKHKKRGAKEENDDDDDDYDSDDEVEDPGSKIITGHMASLRADLVLKTGLGIARNKIETLFYESKIRVNGAKIPKKSQKVYVGDELDVIKGPSPVNENMTVVSRVVVLNAKEHEDGDKLVVKMRRYKSLTVESLE